MSTILTKPTTQGGPSASSKASNKNCFNCNLPVDVRLHGHCGMSGRTGNSTPSYWVRLNSRPSKSAPHDPSAS
ncbi:hypothetical protein IAQ61_010686 [Plenodomus lingam]|uniref:uncharacterized protein n=1 Tax=Leptosphaeria maculans TaxID=5022 RepID=UPI003318F844|nr:hypothetical protein IAQ61_010686 [Plenodomus lingam]